MNYLKLSQTSSRFYLPPFFFGLSALLLSACGGGGGGGSSSIAVSDTNNTEASTAQTEQISSSTVKISWEAPTFNENGSELTNLSGFKVYYGQSAQKLDKLIIINDPQQTFIKIDTLSADRLYFFSITAFNDSGFESRHTNIVQIQL
ncbi:fibronectin type III domain-containing protein [Psychromonas aquimarina]|uniref:fibronectin type III domain-containing protein n=1 Tax=Psychromonas aquimarina TaxID=444919 RepID=UPI0003FA2B43|nr:fibronectin type III domain-containing protein [Psychromonas aquimarina]